MTVSLEFNHSVTHPPAATSPMQPPWSPLQQQQPSRTDSGDEEEAVGPDGRPGYGAVQNLATYLISLDSVTFLTNQQADHIVSLWDKLPDSDRQHLVYSCSYRQQLLTGRFRQKKRCSFYMGQFGPTHCLRR